MRYITLPENIETGYFVLDNGALAAVPEVIKKAFPGCCVQIIADGNTYKAAGEKVFQLCNEHGLQTYEPIVLPADPRPHPDYSLSQSLAQQLPADCVPVAVGSGVITDLVKCAADICKKRYCCVATACSVDGYTSNGGAMSVDQLKKTVPCPAPYALIADTAVMQTAPLEMLASGYADLMSKVTGGADWIIADELGIEKIAPAIWSLVQDDLRDNLADPGNMEKIFLGLAATGYSMQMYHDSRPASGAEHLCSHVWEMEKLSCNGQEISHGFKVGIGLLAVSQLQEFVINTTVEQARRLAAAPLDEDARKKEIADLLKLDCYGSNVSTLAMEKSLSGAELQNRREHIFAAWGNLQKRLAKQLLPSSELRKMLKNADAPTHFSQIGLSYAQYIHGIKTAQLIRKRYTVLDMLYETGLLDAAINTIQDIKL